MIDWSETKYYFKNFAIFPPAVVWCGSVSKYRPLIVILDLCGLLGSYYSNRSIHAHVKPVSILFWVKLLFFLTCFASSPPLPVVGATGVDLRLVLRADWVQSGHWLPDAGFHAPSTSHLPIPQSAQRGHEVLVVMVAVGCSNRSSSTGLSDYKVFFVFFLSPIR
jgi:hypothetical protein